MSYTVARLQEQLGVPLFQIQGCKAQLTEARQALLRRFRHLGQEALEQGQADLAIAAHVPSSLLGERLIAIAFMAVAHHAAAVA